MPNNTNYKGIGMTITADNPRATNERIEVSYDIYERKLRIGEQTVKQPIIILDRAEFAVKEGERDGCVSSGYLGFVNGIEMQQGNISLGQFAQMEPIRWDYNRFVNAQGHRVVSAEQVMMVGSSIVAFNPITD